MRKNSQKNISGFAQIAPKKCEKFAKKNCAKIAQVLRKNYSHFVETLLKVYFNPLLSAITMRYIK